MSATMNMCRSFVPCGSDKVVSVVPFTGMSCPVMSRREAVVGWTVVASSGRIIEIEAPVSRIAMALKLGT